MVCVCRVCAGLWAGLVVFKLPRIQSADPFTDDYPYYDRAHRGFADVAADVQFGLRRGAQAAAAVRSGESTGAAGQPDIRNARGDSSGRLAMDALCNADAFCGTYRHA